MCADLKAKLAATEADHGRLQCQVAGLTAQLNVTDGARITPSPHLNNSRQSVLPCSNDECSSCSESFWIAYVDPRQHSVGGHQSALPTTRLFPAVDLGSQSYLVGSDLSILSVACVAVAVRA